jgi:hypothetical protein
VPGTDGTFNFERGVWGSESYDPLMLRGTKLQHEGRNYDTTFSHKRKKTTTTFVTQLKKKVDKHEKSLVSSFFVAVCIAIPVESV